MTKRNENRPGYKKTKVGWIPEDWNCKQLKAVSSVKTGPFGAQLHQSDYVEKGTPIVTVEHLSEFGLIHQNLPLVSDEDRKRLSQYIIKQGDIVFSRVGSVDRNSFVTEKEDGWLFSGRLLRVRTDNDKLVSAFLSYFFNQEYFKHRIRSVAVGGTMSCLNTSLLGGVWVSIPPILEQRKIAEILSTWNKAIEQTQKLIEAKRSLKKALMQQLLTGKRRFPEFKEPWKEVSVADLCTDIGSGGTPSTSVPEYWKGTIPWVTGADFTETGIGTIRRHITEQAVQNSATRVCPKGCILFVSRTGVGKIAIAPFDIAVSQDITALELKSALVDTRFMIFALIISLSRFQRFNQGTSIKGVTRKDLIRYQFLVPTLSEQKRIAAVLHAANKEIEALCLQSDKLKEQKRGLMQKLLTGEIRHPIFVNRKLSKRRK